MMDTYILTGSGKRFYPSKPEFDITDIASALSKQCRFGGHTTRFYSVAEHSVLVRNIMVYFDLGNPFEGLMHDAHEAYVSDMVSPWKAILPDYRALEASVMVPLRVWQDLPEETTDGCKTADWIALILEARKLTATLGKDLWLPERFSKDIVSKAREYEDKLRYKLGWSPNEAYNRFLETYYNAKEVVSL